MSNYSYWKKQEQKFTSFTKTAVFPSASLSRVDFVDINKISDFEKIPNEAGCYWIWTNEKIVHSFHSGNVPKEVSINVAGRKVKGEVVYNGVAQSIRGRVKNNHLLADVNAGWSGISTDIYFKRVKSHKKRAMGPKKKVP